MGPISEKRPPRVRTTRQVSPPWHSRDFEKSTRPQGSPSKATSSSSPASPLFGDLAEFGAPWSPTGKPSPASPGAGLGAILGRCAADTENGIFAGGKTGVPCRTPTCTGSAYMSGEQDVKLHMYDLSKGMARTLGSWLLEGVDGVWHSGVVVFGQEYYFNGDLVHDSPGETRWGEPTKVLTIGHTGCRMKALHHFVVDELRSVFNKNSYDALYNNCNHFADRLCMYLCQRHIPDPILQQPQQLATLPALRLLRPFLDQWLGSGASGTEVCESSACIEAEPQRSSRSRRRRDVRQKSGHTARESSLGPASSDMERELGFEGHSWRSEF